MTTIVQQIDYKALMVEIENSVTGDATPKWWFERYPIESLNLDNNLAWKDAGGMSVKNYAAHQWDTLSYGLRRACYYSPVYHRSIINYKWGGTVYLGILSIHKKYGYDGKSWIMPPPIFSAFNKNYRDDSDSA
jgi:hypothetical protein